MANYNGRTNETGSAARTVILIGAAVMAVILIIGGIYLFQFKDNQKKPDQTPSQNDIVKDFSELIAEGSEASGIYEDLEIADMTLGEAFALYEENSSYYHECTVTTVGTDGTKLERIKRVLRDGDKINIRTYNKNTLIETVKCDGENILVINETTGTRNKLPLTEDTNPMELASMPSHSFLLALLDEYNADPENSAISDRSYSLTRARDMNMLTVTVKYRDSDLSESYYYYLNYGIIYHCTSEAAGSTAKPYAMNTTFFSRDISDFVTEDSFTVN